MAPGRLSAEVAVLVALVAAGCSDGGPAQAVQDAAGASVHGVVVDEAIRPLANATVTLASAAGPTMSAVTGDDGLFRFVGLPEGIVALRVEKAFYAPVQLTAPTSLDPGAPAVKVTLQLEVGILPFANQVKWDGFLECSAGIGNWCGIANLYPCIVQSQVGQPCSRVSGDNSFNYLQGFFTDLQRIPTWVQMEAVWESTQSVSRNLGIRYAATNQSEWDRFSFGPVLASVHGPSPLVAWAPGPGDIDTNNFMGNGTRLNESGLGLIRGMTTELFHGAPDGAPPQTETLCTPEPDNPVVNGCFTNQWLGVAANQPITIVYTAFYGYAPPDGWTFSGTGAVPPPPR